jgi:hypothetical protein
VLLLLCTKNEKVEDKNMEQMIQEIEVEDNDVIVVKVSDAYLNNNDKDIVRSKLQPFFPNNKIMVIDKDVSIQIIKIDDANKEDVVPLSKFVEEV